MMGGKIDSRNAPDSPILPGPCTAGTCTGVFRSGEAGGKNGLVGWIFGKGAHQIISLGPRRAIGGLKAYQSLVTYLWLAFQTPPPPWCAAQVPSKWPSAIMWYEIGLFVCH